MWNRILIARPGEVAARVARTCKRSGIAALVASPEARAAGVHREACDELLNVAARDDGSVDPSEIVRVAREAKADAVYSGYGTEPWDRDLARLLESEDIPFVGADPEAMDVVFDIETLRRVAETAMVRMVPEGGPPIERARVIDVLVAADMHGELLAICEQESTASAYLGLTLDESPSPELRTRADGESIRMALFESAIRLTSELRTPGLVTVRFLLDADARSFISEVKLGLLGQHGVAEMVTGLDLVSVQLAIAAGEPIPDEAHAAEPTGHAFGAAVGLAKNAAPAALREIRFPPAPQRQVRFDPGIAEGQIPNEEDRHALCRVTTYAPIRHLALLTLDRMLAEIDISPLDTNAGLLRALLAHESFRAGQYDSEIVASA